MSGALHCPRARMTTDNEIRRVRCVAEYMAV